MIYPTDLTDSHRAAGAVASYQSFIARQNQATQTQAIHTGHYQRYPLRGQRRYLLANDAYRFT